MSGALATAVQLAREGLESARTPAELSYLSTAVDVWSKLSYATPTGALSPLWTRVVAPGTGEVPGLPRKPDDRSTLAKRFVFSWQVEEAEASRFSTDFGKMVDTADASCSEPPTACAARELRTARVQLALPNAASAAQALENATRFAEQSKDPVTIGLVDMARGDALLAPNSEPLLLNLALFEAASVVDSLGREPADRAVISGAALSGAQSWYDRAAAAFRGGDCRRCELDLAARRAMLAYSRGDALRALEDLRAAAASFAEAGDLLGHDRALVAALGCALSLNRHDVVSSLVDEFVRVAEERPGTTYAALQVTRLQARRLLAERQDLGAALQAPVLGRRMADALRDPSLQREQDRLMAETLHALGRHHESLAIRKQLFQSLDRKSSDVLVKAEYAELMAGIRSDLYSLGDYEQSLAWSANEPRTGIPSLLGLRRFEEALQLARREHEPNFEVIALVYLNRKNEARRLLAKLLDSTIRQIATEPRAPRDFRDLNANHVRHNVLEEAINLAPRVGLEKEASAAWKAAEAAVGSAFLFSDPDEPWERDAITGELEVGKGDNAAAEAAFERAWAKVDAFVSKLGGPAEADGVVGQVAWLLRAHVDLLFRQGRHADALALIDYVQARSLNTHLLQTASRARSGTGSAREDTLRRWWEAEAKLDVMRRRLPYADVRREPELATAIHDTEVLRDELGRSIPLAELRPARVSGEALLADLRKSLSTSTNTRLLICFPGTGEVITWVVDATGIVAAHRVPSAPGEFSANARALISALQNDTDYRAPAAALSRWILSGLSPSKRTTESRPALGVVLLGDATNLPVQLLPAPQRALLMDTDTFLLPSLSSYARISKHGRTRDSSTVVAFGLDADGLTEAEAEARSIGAAPEHTFTGPAATLVRYRSEAALADVLHVSSHGRFVREDPYASGIVFTDGVLTPERILAVPLSARVVLLSACDSAQVESTPGYDVVGAVPAFLASGAPAVIAATTRVGQSDARRLMPLVHDGLRRGETPAAALANAARVMLKADPSITPRIWAGFSVYGAGG